MSKSEIESTLNEVRILCSINDPYVVGYKDAFLNNNSKELCIGNNLKSSHGICGRRRSLRQNH